jgi:hypothetical protein
VDLRRSAELVDRSHTFLKDDLLRGGPTHDLREIAAVRSIPVGAADIVQA